MIEDDYKKSLGGFVSCSNSHIPGILGMYFIFESL